MKKQFSVLIGLAALVLMLSQVVLAAGADWEWSRDKGWTQGLGKALPTPGEQLKHAWQMEKDGSYLNATKQYFLLLKTYPDSEEAGVGLQRLANCLFMMENYYDSYKALEQVIKTYPLSAKKSDLIKIEFLIGRKFQQGARKDLLNDQEPVNVSKEAAIEIFKSVIDNDPVGPYAGAATLAVGYCYKDLNQPKMGIVYTDRVINEFSMSAELVAKARILKKTLEVMEGKSSVDSVKTAIRQAEAVAKENKDGGTGQGDFAPVTDYKHDINELEETQAKKLWDAAEFYKSRGTRESITAYKFSLEQLIIRLPNTSYAQKARRIVGDVKIPPKQNSLGKINIPVLHKVKEPSFVVQPNSGDYVQSTNIPVPGADASADAPLSVGSAALAKPATPPTLRTAPEDELPLPTPGAKPAAANAGKNQPLAATSAANAPAAPANTGSAAAATPKTPANAKPARPAASAAPRGNTPPGESGASILPGAIAKTSSSAASVAPAPAPGAASGSVSDKTISKPVYAPTAANNKSAVPPSDSGSSVFPAAINKTADAPKTSAPASATTTPSANSAAGAAPKAAALPAMTDADMEALGKARTTANDAAAKNNNWNFGEDFK